jgi:hypothetical protein
VVERETKLAPASFVVQPSDVGLAAIGDEERGRMAIGAGVEGCGATFLRRGGMEMRLRREVEADDSRLGRKLVGAPTPQTDVTAPLDSNDPP